MSDLAPFVATVLKDRAVVEMMAGLEKLRRLVDDRLKVQITGRKGTPVYREGSLRDGHSSHRGRCFELIFNDDGDCRSEESRGVVPLSALGDLEIHLGGLVVQKLGNAQSVIGSCNAPFFTDDDFYRDTKHNTPKFLDAHRKEIVLKIKNKRKGPVPFVIARFGDEMDYSLEYAKLRDLNMATLELSGEVSTIVVEGLAFSETEIRESLSILEAIGYNVDEGNSHRHYVHAVDETRSPIRKKQKKHHNNNHNSAVSLEEGTHEFLPTGSRSFLLAKPKATKHNARPEGRE